MSDRDDDLDPSDWLAAQFGQDEKPAPEPVAPTEPTPPEVPAAPSWPLNGPSEAVTPEPPSWPTPGAPAAPLAPTWPAAAQPTVPEPVWPAAAALEPATPQPEPVWPAAAQPAVPEPVWPEPATPQPTPPPPEAVSQPAPPQPAAPPSGGGFSWGLTPGEDPAVVAASPPPLIPPPAAAPPFSAQTEAMPPVVVPPVVLPPAQPVAPPTVAAPLPSVEPTPPAAAPAYDYDQPTQAMPIVGSELEPRDLDPSSWFAAPVDGALDGVTEVIEAEIIGLPAPEGEGLEQPSGLDALFSDTAFQEYDDQIVSAPPPRAPGDGGGPKAPKPPAAPIPKVQKILMIVAGSLVGLLAIIALFVIGMRLSDRILPVAAPTPTPTPTETAPPITLGPVDPGVYQWNELLGGECLATWEGAWTQTFEVVDCAGEHPAQLVGRGLFEETEFAPYPGFDVLLGRMNALCTAPTIIDYSLARQFGDLQIAATIPVDEDDWDTGNRSFFCFVTRSSGADLTGTIAKPAVLPTPTATPTPTASGVPSTATPGGRAIGTAPPKQ